MKILAITQRVQKVADYQEQRDSLDRRWWGLAITLGFLPQPLPNVETSLVGKLLDSVSPDALILSGGNSLCSLNSEAADCSRERDEFERALVELAVREGIPVVGVCRGMQLLNLLYGGKLSRVEGHVAERHGIVAALSDASDEKRDVNSYHNWGIAPDGLGKGLVPLYFSQIDGSVEAFRHDNHRVAGMMWHPERESEFDTTDLELLKEFLL